MSGSSVIGREVHQVNLASQTAYRVGDADRDVGQDLRRVRHVQPLLAEQLVFPPVEVLEGRALPPDRSPVCSKLRLAAISWTICSSACQAGEPYSGRRRPELVAAVITHGFQVPASGLSGSTNPGGVGSQKPGPVGPSPIPVGVGAVALGAGDRLLADRLAERQPGLDVAAEGGAGRHARLRRLLGQVLNRPGAASGRR